MTTEARPDVRIPLSVALALATVAISAGSALATIHMTTTAQAELAHRVDEHVSAPGHAVALQRIEQLERGQAALEAEQRGTLVELRGMAARIEQANANIVALCAATRGAQCTR